MSARPSRPAWTWLVAALPVAVLLLLLIAASPVRVWEVLGAADPGLVGFALACFGMHVVTWGLRWHLLLRAVGAEARAGATVAFQVLADAVLLTVPLRAGELLVPGLLRATHGVAIGEGLALLALVRLLDVLVLAGLALFALAAAAPVHWMPAVVAVCVGLSAVGLAAVWREWGLDFLSERVPRVAPWLIDARRALARIRQRPEASAAVLALGILAWLLLGAGIMSLGRALQVPVAATTAAQIAVAGVVAGVVPAPEALGAEASLATGILAAHGVRLPAALAVGVLVHGAMMAVVAASATAVALSGWGRRVLRSALDAMGSAG